MTSRTRTMAATLLVGTSLFGCSTRDKDGKHLAELTKPHLNDLALLDTELIAAASDGGAAKPSFGATMEKAAKMLAVCDKAKVEVKELDQAFQADAYEYGDDDIKISATTLAVSAGNYVKSACEGDVGLDRAADCMGKCLAGWDDLAGSAYLAVWKLTAYDPALPKFERHKPK